MTDVVGKTDASDDPGELPEPTGPTSPLELLYGKREELDRRLHLDLPVARWDELFPGHQVWVRYRPGDPAVLTSAIERRERDHQKATSKGGPGDKHRITKANADFLVAACMGVYALPAGEEPPDGDLPTDLPTFGSPELSQAVGAPDNAVETVRKVYATDGDLMIAANQLLEWSGKAIPKADKDF